ncbi:unnamed protein product [Hapterophycus canaliculatus]
MTDKEEATAGLEKVTDYHVEKELNEDDTANALSSLSTNSAKTTSTEPSTEASLKISAADIEVLKDELEVSSEEAKTALLTGNGDLVQAFRKLLR